MRNMTIMKNATLSASGIGIFLGLVSSLGCAMCASNLDDFYGAYGGRRARADMRCGRVGSIIDPAPETTESLMIDPAKLTVPSDMEPTPADAASSKDSSTSEEDKAATKRERGSGPELGEPFSSDGGTTKAAPAEADAMNSDETLEAVPEEAVPEEAAPEEAVPEEAAPEELFPEAANGADTGDMITGDIDEANSADTTSR